MQTDLFRTPRQSKKTGIRVETEDLKRLYFDRGLNTKEVGKLVGISSEMVSYWLKKAGLKPRTPDITNIGRMVTDETRNKLSGGNHWNWKDGRTKINGYAVIRMDHPRSDKNGYVLEHIVIAEKALGKSLPQKAQIHHWKGKENFRGNLVICQDFAYHALIHKRMRSLAATGSLHNYHCAKCGQWKHKSNFQKDKSDYCRQCRNELCRQYQKGRHYATDRPCS